MFRLGQPSVDSPTRCLWFVTSNQNSPSTFVAKYRKLFEKFKIFFSLVSFAVFLKAICGYNLWLNRIIFAWSIYRGARLVTFIFPGNFFLDFKLYSQRVFSFVKKRLSRKHSCTKLSSVSQKCCRVPELVFCLFFLSNIEASALNFSASFICVCRLEYHSCRIRLIITRR